MDRTLAIIKPHVVRNTPAFKGLMNLIQKNFTVLESKEIHITKQIFDNFYCEHKGKFFYNRLESFMGSGPSFALILQADNAITKWRQLMGPTKVYKAIYTDPLCVRSLFGLSDTRNACHGSDSEESVNREIAILFSNSNSKVIKQKLNS